ALVEGLYYAEEKGARVVNLSLSYAPAVYPGSVLDEALDELKSQGILVFAASGNQGVPTVAYPAAHPSVIAVGASQPTATGEDAGRPAYGTCGRPLDPEVPGGDFKDVDGDGRNDAILGETFDPEFPGVFSMWATAGTSGATAQASGVAALLLAAAATDSAR